MPITQLPTSQMPTSQLPTSQRRCPGCRAVRAFVQPPCADGHGLDCPERACSQCGAAVFVGS